MQANLPSLSISCVYYDTDLDIFRKTINSLLESVNCAKERQVLSSAELHLINNNSDKSKDFLIVVHELEGKFDSLVVHNGQGNIGYGKANNLAISSVSSDFHLVLNPDVFLAEDNIFNAIHHMQNKPQLDAIAADAFDSENNRLYLAKREPSLIVLLARAINSRWLNRLLKQKLDAYEYRDLIPNSSNALDIELMSGCYMFFRTTVLKTVKGFDPKYFLYFEDFDLSRRLHKKELAFNVKIYHLGGNASRKGIGHIKMFFISMAKYLQNR